jgi:hypothetical protein
MGEAKRRRLAVAAGSCLCGSAKAANVCCLKSGKWHREAAAVVLRETGQSGAHLKCYLRQLNACSNKITSEHYVSQAALRVLADEMIDISGFPWLKGESRVMNFASMTSNCLCSAHNSALSPLDAVAGQFFQAIKDCGTVGAGPSRRYIFSGHDLERWFLKTLASLEASGNLASNKERMTGGFHEDIDVPGMLEEPSLWKKPVGLYFGGFKGQVIQRRDLFHFAPLITLDTNKLAGITTVLQGFDFSVLATVPIETAEKLADRLHRPGGLVFNYPGVKHVIEISWDDDLEHLKIVMAEDAQEITPTIRRRLTR